jgi:uncharacterized protein
VLLPLVKLAKDENDIDRKNAKGYSPLMLAAYNGHLEATRYLISIGADIDSTDNSGNSILMGVAFKGHKEILQLLLLHKANARHRNAAGQDALQFAQMFGRFDCADLLRSNQGKSRWWQVISAWFSYINPLKRERKAV